ncbi:tail assembly chaperone [Mycobacterium phage Jasper]|nr:tail assembly chaperone [Mycobacterium phage Jasper]YP_009283271.1 tail assembly chaperone [Mycobacterium phage Papez]AWN02537.1 tail assembly chaperone [Mycobacterium phage Oogway]AXQ51304.1 tail assembly chaperone [Mycobacterium phage Adahisdi]QGH80212.1 tail assembly chaperone [Mycobacterium phage KyMonks1A]UJD21218.1 tail assembly chaperone [Mycobacterium phage Eyeball]ACE80039.1 tail assembly chaperone [Mycobacterium phage Jasper]
MSTILNLDNIREEADREFGAPVPIQIDKDTVVHLRNATRLRKDVRKDVLKQLDIIKAVNDKSSDDTTEADVDKLTNAVFKILSLAAGRDSKTLLDAIDEDVAVATKILNHWLEETQVGGSLQLGGLIDDYGDALYADFRSHYHMNLADLFDPTSRLGPIQVLALIKELPREGRFWSEKQGGPQFRGWTDQTYTTAALVNEIRALKFMYLLANTSKDKRRRLTPPEPFPVPQVKAHKAKKYKPGSFGAVAAMRMAASRNRKAQATGR